MIWWFIFLAVILILIGIAYLRGKCDGLIAGYNTSSPEKQKVNLNWLTFNYFVDNDDYLSNFLEGLVKLDRFKESVWKHIF